MPAWLRGRGRTYGYLALSLLGALALALVLTLGGAGDPSAADEPSPGPTTAAFSPGAGDRPAATAQPTDAPGQPTARAGDPPAHPSPPPPEPSVQPDVEEERELALVPVVGFWSPETSISLAQLERALTRGNAAYRRVIVPRGDERAIEAALGIRLGAHVESGDGQEVRRAVRRDALGLLPVGDITPAVRALALDDRSLFGNDRLDDADLWPLRVIVTGGEDDEPWDQSATWTLVAGGDIQLDRWMAHHVTELDKGVDWPWDGGVVRITRRVCCSDLGHLVPLWERTSDGGEVRTLIQGADLAMANLEAAAVDDPLFHGLGPRFRFSLSFSGDPRLLQGIKNAGFDFLSLANNHIHDAGPQGIRDTRRHLHELAIAFAGAGRDIDQATEPAHLKVAGQRVVVLSCTTIGHMAREDRAGAASCSGRRLVRQIESAAREADVVIVFPHWGREYRATPNINQHGLAGRWVAAGADLILGAHSHWAGAIEEIGDSLVFYSMGNLAFDQPWSEPTMQGLILELTFNVDRLVQVRLHPTLIVDHVQPNLLEHDAGGDRVINRMRDASDGLLAY